MGEEYKKALKSGQKNYRACLAKGEYPYLPALDDFLPESRQAMAKDVGLMQIPEEFVVGTKTKARQNIFARNFMPLADEKSEFMTKWTRLCDAHLEEGIRDPVTVYEYMNRYYVIEGNKRVSVLKYFDAATISANVRRIMPEHNGSPEVERYFAFLDFSKYSGINYLEFSHKESYTRFQQLMGKEAEELWTEDDRLKFSTVFYYFKKAFQAQNGENLKNVTVGDALLACLKVYGYENIKNLNADQIKSVLRKVWEDVSLQQNNEQVELKLDPTDVNASVVSKITTKTVKGVMSVSAKPLKIAFVYPTDPIMSSWIYRHDIGRQHVEDVFGAKIETSVYSNASFDRVEEVLNQAIADGANVIFTASAEMIQASLRVAVENPKIKILNCSIYKSHRYIRFYYTRLYEAKMIAGAIAGALAGEKDVGYICKYPINGSVSEINAFARGVALVNPRAKVHLEWSILKKDYTENVKDATKICEKRLREKGIKLISYRDFINLEQEQRSRFGLEFVDDHERMTLVLPVINWGVYYEKLLNEMLEGTFTAETKKTEKALNYYWGMSAGVIDLIYSGKIPKGVRYMAETLSKAIVSGQCKPFYDPEVKEDGSIEWDTQERTISMEDITRMDWLESNVVGSIPKYEEIDERFRAVVDAVGINVSQKTATVKTSDQDKKE